MKQCETMCPAKALAVDYHKLYTTVKNIDDRHYNYYLEVCKLMREACKYEIPDDLKEKFLVLESNFNLGKYIYYKNGKDLVFTQQ